MFKNFLRYFYQEKIILFSGFLILFLLLLPSPVFAFWTWLRDAILFVPTLLIATVLTVAILLTGGIAYLMGALLDWIISPGFVSLSYTIPCPAPSYSPTAPGADPNCNPVIGLGLNITQSFVNLILVVILVYIALAIALRLGGERSAKQYFIRLIIVALLVNFASVFLGLIVDATNIVMNYFLEPIRGGTSGVMLQISTFWDGVIKAIGGAGGEITKRFGLLAMGAIQIFLNLAIAFAFLLFAGIFLFRYIAIWVLVILAPIAFVFWILPQTKKFWDTWWNQFIQWSIIGIPIAFFLYLGLGSFQAISTSFRANLEAPAIESSVVGWFNQVLPFFIVVIFLFLGFLIGLSTAAMGATTIIQGGKTTGKWAGKAVAKGVGRRVEESARIREAAGKVTQAWERVPGARWFLPEKLRTYSEFRPAVTAAAERAKPFSSREIAYRMAIGADYGVAAAGGMMTLIERGDFQDFFNAYKKKYYGSRWEKVSDQDLLQHEGFKKEVDRKLQIILRSSLFNTVVRSEPRLAKLCAGKLAQYKELSPEQAAVQAVSEARSQHINNWEREVLEDEDVVKGGMERGRDFWESVLRQVKRSRETSLESIDLIFTEFINEHKELAHATEEELDTAWQRFREDFKVQHGGRDAYFEYIESDWGKKQGWRPGKYLTTEEVKAIEERRRGGPPEGPPEGPPTPGEAMGLPRPPRGRPGVGRATEPGTEE